MIDKVVFLTYYFLIGSFLVCNTSVERKETYPTEILTAGLDSLFDNAKWEIYKCNLLEGEEYFNGTTDPRGDTLLTDFESLDLHFRSLIERGDTISFQFSFGSPKIQIVKRELETEVSFINSTIIGLDLFNHIGVIYDKPGPILEEEFKEYLQSKNPSDLNPWLLQEAKKRGVIP